MERKTYKFTELKLDTEGEGTFEAVFATLDAIDHDGDTYDPGAIGKQDVVISQWNHGSWNGGVAAMPVGVGKVFERGNKAIVQGEFDMDDPAGKAHHHKLKYLFEKGHNVEWSFALPDMDTRHETIDDETVRVITRVAIPEVSPVLLGAGVGTELLSIKGKGDDMESKSDESMAFVKELDAAVVAVESVVGRAKQIQNLRVEKGKGDMSRASTRRLKALRDALKEVLTDVDDLLTDPNDELNELAASFTEEHNAEGTG